MDENGQHGALGGKAGGIVPGLLYLLLGLALAVLFCYRVASTSPRWNAPADPAGAPTPQADILRQP